MHHSIAYHMDTLTGGIESEGEGGSGSGSSSGSRGMGRGRARGRGRGRGRGGGGDEGSGSSLPTASTIPDVIETGESGLYPDPPQQQLDTAAAAEVSYLNIGHKAYLGVMVTSGQIYQMLTDLGLAPVMAPM
jgi:hypothetical protein